MVESLLFILEKLSKYGWQFSGNELIFDGNKWVFSKENKVIKVRIIEYSTNYPRFKIDSNNADFYIFTNLTDCYIIPQELVNNVDNPTFTFRKLKNKFEILDLKSKKMLIFLIDCGIQFSEIEQNGIFFKKEGLIAGSLSKPNNF